MLESIDEKINILLPKRKKERNILPLRDPVNTELFDIFIAAAGSTAKYKQDLKCTILFHTFQERCKIGRNGPIKIENNFCCQSRNSNIAISGLYFSFLPT